MKSMNVGTTEGGAAHLLVGPSLDALGPTDGFEVRLAEAEVLSGLRQWEVEEGLQALTCDPVPFLTNTAEALRCEPTAGRQYQCHRRNAVLGGVPL